MAYFDHMSQCGGVLDVGLVFAWFSLVFGDVCPMVAGVCRVADGSVVCFWVFGWGSWRGMVGFGLVVLGHGLSHGEFGVEIRRVRVVLGGFLGQNPILCGVCAEWACIGVGGVLGMIFRDESCLDLVGFCGDMCICVRRAETSAV